MEEQKEKIIFDDTNIQEQYKSILSEKSKLIFELKQDIENTDLNNNEEVKKINELIKNKYKDIDIKKYIDEFILEKLNTK